MEPEPRGDGTLADRDVSDAAGTGSAAGGGPGGTGLEPARAFGRTALRRRLRRCLVVLAPRAVHAGDRLRAHAVAAPAAVYRHWRRSLQFRVAATTFLTSGAISAIVGGMLLAQVTNGVLDAKVKAATQEASGGVNYARDQVKSTDDTDSDSLRFSLSTTTHWLALQGGNEGSGAGLFDVVFESRNDPTLNQVSGDNVDTRTIPDDLRRLVHDGDLSYAYAPIHHHDGSTTPGLIVGGPVRTSRGDTLGLYYLFSLDNEKKTLALIRRIVYLSGLGIVLLVSMISVLVTGQVVRPVRIAAQTATRFAEGHLEERMKVTGEDDLSLLASRFNDMADSLHRQITRLEELSRLQRRFTSDVSHELRTPLTTVRMAADLLHAQREDFPPELARSVELLHNELDRFEVLLGDLLEISRYDAGAAVLESEPVDLRTVVDRVVSSTATLAAQEGTEVVLHVPSVAVVADIDSRRVERILRNLVCNAVEHGEQLPVEITLAGDEHAVAVTVRDHGVGLRPGESAMVFNRFWRADPSRNRRTGGTGLGLSISLEDARLHGGWLHAWGRRGAGSQFRLTLPRRRGETVLRSPLPLQPRGATRADPDRAEPPAAADPGGGSRADTGVPGGGDRGVGAAARRGHGGDTLEDR